MNELQAQIGPYRATSCEWTDTDDEKGHVFCGGPLKLPSCYCDKHLAMAYKPKSTKKTSKKSQVKIDKQLIAELKIIDKENLKW